METILKSIEDHWVACICLDVFVIIIIDEIKE